MEVAGLIISISALLLALFTYFKHDWKIKKQATLLNKYQLEKIEQEKIVEKRAILEANVISIEKGTRIIKVYNKGRSLAKRVNVIIPDGEGYDVFINPCPIDIRPQNGIEIKLALYMNGPDKIDLTFEWADDYKEKNSEVQTVQI